MSQLKLSFPDIVRTWLAFSIHLILRINHDRLMVNAGYMAYVTLLSLVPLMTVLLSALSVFSSASSIEEEIKTFLLRNFLPASNEVLEIYLNQFIANAGKVTVVGVAFLLLVALMLMSAIDKSLNYIWRVNQKRAPMISFSIYWMVLTLGPILLSGSISISSYMGSLNFFHLGSSEKWLSSLLRTVPFFLVSATFLGLYTLVPNRPVVLWHALVGAVSAGLMFEFSKKVFAIYVVNFPSYDLIYGTLAVVPLLFIWVFLSWCIVLLGAEITTSLGEKQFWQLHRPQK
ncbi:virulence factor BrkB family protein [Candidatus Enterovibrio escicola]|uniref:virulence factor BrkB family protein n=1 Tax=Candidatus Enterovibrio escicola TaxID=1927127 RepID=UPI001CC25284|nr:virulence factor BrkB family protein [Candidatus Enterovibrio escacola]